MFSGAMDILVIESPNGQYKSSAFHVRFGSLKVIKSKEQEVEIYVNSIRTFVKMKLSSSGDAYFQFDELDPQVSQQQNLYNSEIENYENPKEKDILIKDNYNLFKKKYKSFFPSSNQIKQLNLKPDRNEICFICRTSSSGIQTLKSSIYLWQSTSKIVISDIDGTITRSDVLGQVLPMIGKSWAHEGVTELFTKIQNQGYKLIYLTSRAIGQSTMTKNYLDNLIQETKNLPPGPLIMSPDGLFTSLKREVIERKPHLLKIPVLSELKNLFPQDTTPFFAGFGNRDTDGVAYRYLNIPLNNIFLIDTSSKVLRLGEKQKSTYKSIADKVEEIFPLIEN
jgi:phosphatidate phosphatase LPIN